MKIIFRIDTDDQKKIDLLSEQVKNDTLVVPQGEHIKVYVIDNDGKVTIL